MVSWSFERERASVHAYVSAPAAGMGDEWDARAAAAAGSS